MLLSHRTDHDSKIIIHMFAPEEADLKLYIKAFNNYQEELGFLPDYQVYQELVDFRPVTSINITPAELREFNNLTTASDFRETDSRLALLVDSKRAFTLAKIYEMLRNFTPNSKKKVKVFRDMQDAYNWLIEGNATTAGHPA